MYTPGYERENLTKPSITLKLEESDSGMTPAQAAQGMLNGVYCLLDDIVVSDGDWVD